MVQELNAMGLTCPAPVLLVKDAVDNGAVGPLKVLVDNQSSCENVSRFLGSRGFSVEEVREGDSYILLAAAGEGTTPETENAAADAHRGETDAQKVVVLIASDQIGNGDPELGRKLMISYLKTLKEMGTDLWQLIFVNGGIKLTIDNSPVLAEIQDYEQSGVTVLVCGTCLEHFGLTARKQAGGTTNMLDIVSATQLADKVITIG